ncbi:phage tail sheath subtilisin-like domain-containing protein [Streptomyces lavendulae]|uniref:phage tail sheath subtilisin-like domain-containing protein n=1 Tax=Streptomyces lavendulae TaxID=1914 RepID=UPI0033DF69D5
MPTEPTTPGVRVVEVPSGSRPIQGAGSAVPAFIGPTPTGPTTPTLVRSWNQFKDEFLIDGEGGSLLPHAVRGYFTTGGGACYIARTSAATEQPSWDIICPCVADTYIQETDDSPKGSMPTLLVSAAAPKRFAFLRFDLTGIPITTRVTAAKVEVYAPASSGPSVLSTHGVSQPWDEDTLVWSGSPTLSPKTGTLQIGAAAGRHALDVTSLIQSNAEEVSIAIKMETGTGRSLVSQDHLTIENRPTLVVTVEDLEPENPSRQAAYLEALASITSVQGSNPGMIAVPDITRYPADAIAVQRAVAEHCAEHNRMAILDLPPDTSPEQAAAYPATLELDPTAAQYTTLYYPWLTVPGPGGGDTRQVPPCGHVAGVWTQNDARRGVHKPPANIRLPGVTALTVDLTDDQQSPLNQAGVNCLRILPGHGPTIWGARTLSDEDPWRHLNVRRLLTHLEQSIQQGTRWAVHEPHTQQLRTRIVTDTTVFLTDQWRRGALRGSTAAEAFTVVCDDTNNSDDLQRLTCEILVAPVRAAEFITFRISQLLGPR